ncbi:hypothetical protein Patl1_03203 [Pistacia atlantica]|uniref:Uncharacterized protein n=1 Tax=Pistacia atlantica TaxID=434234 RepID=A0ACC1CDJ2_9ROSI|nr:hypothetical protein Patl1_03203 [Pistacia atlantica]
MGLDFGFLEFGLGKCGFRLWTLDFQNKIIIIHILIIN